MLSGTSGSLAWRTSALGSEACSGALFDAVGRKSLMGVEARTIRNRRSPGAELGVEIKDVVKKDLCQRLEKDVDIGHNCQRT